MANARLFSNSDKYFLVKIHLKISDINLSTTLESGLAFKNSDEFDRKFLSPEHFFNLKTVNEDIIMNNVRGYIDLAFKQKPGDKNIKSRLSISNPNGKTSYFDLEFNDAEEIALVFSKYLVDEKIELAADANPGSAMARCLIQ